MRPSRSTSATSPSRAAPSSFATRARSTSAFSSASICTARPPSKRTRRPRTTVPSTSSGFVAVTTPSVRVGSGVVKTSSVGRFGLKTTPSTVVEPGASPANCEVGSRPTVRSVPGPSKCSESSPAASSRLPTACSSPTRSRHARRGVVGRRAAACRRAAPRASPAQRRRRAPDARPVPTRPSPTERRTSSSSASLITLEVRPAASAAGRGRRRQGRRPSINPGGIVGATEIRTPCPSPSWRIRCGYQGGMNSSESGSATSARMRFTCGSKYQGSKNRAPRAYASAATARISGAAVGAPIIRMSWPGWTFVPTSTISLA